MIQKITESEVMPAYVLTVKWLDTAGGCHMENRDIMQPEDEKEITDKLGKKLIRAESSVKDYQFFLLRLVFFVVVLWLLFYVFIGIVIMPTADMYPRIDAGDMVIFYRLDKDVCAQDVVAIKKEVPTLSGEQLIICRVVAAEGDTVEISSNGRLIVNGNSIIENNIFYDMEAYEDFVEYPLTLAEGEYFVLADNRRDGTDSRFFGPVQKDEILGTVFSIVRRNNL